jgi:MFS family permease
VGTRSTAARTGLIPAAVRPAAPWVAVVQAAAALAVSMGIGRFVYTPILPLMHAQAGLSAEAGSALATANYVGYLAGALLGIVARRLVRSALAYRASLAVVVLTVALMAATTTPPTWLVLRFAAGVASALAFVIASTALLDRLREHAAHLAGWAFGGVGAGIALSGTVVLLVRPTGTWRTAWLASAALAVVLSAVAWSLRPADPATPEATARPDRAANRSPATAPDPTAPDPVTTVRPVVAQIPAALNPTAPGPTAPGPTVPDPATAARPVAAPTPAAARPGGMWRSHRWFATLLASYTLEGVGYIIAGTFLVAAIGQNTSAGAATSAWVVVGLAAFPAPALWAWLSRRRTRPTLLLIALVIQAAGIALPALAGGAIPALVSAALFGATFLGVASLVLAIGAHLGYPRAVAVLTAGYGAGQILGPLIVTPLLHNGYRVPLLIGAAIVLAAAGAAAALRVIPPDGPRSRS